MRLRALLWLALLVAAAARADTVKRTGLDMVLLVDRSGSISPAGRRLENELVDLTMSILARSTREERVQHRVAVVSFGNAARIDLPLSAVDQPALQTIRAKLAAAESRRSLGNTNFPAACDAAAAMFTAADGRRRSILLVTDGRAYVPGITRDEIVRRMQRIVSSKLPPPTTVDLLILGSGRDAAPWRHLSGVHVRVARGRTEALAALHRNVGDLLGTPGQQLELRGALDTIELPPYLDLVVFDIIRDPTASEVSLFAPGARQPLEGHGPGVEEVRLGDAFFTLAVQRPAAGVWTFRKANADSRVRVLMQQFFPRGMLVGPDPRSHLLHQERVTVAYRLVDADGATLQELEAYPLSVDLMLARPDGRRIALPMKRASLSGVYRAAAPAECDVAGRYWTEVVVNAWAGGRAVRVFEDRWSGFSVLAAPAVDCRLNELTAGDRVRIDCGDTGAAALPPALRMAVHRGGRRVAPDLRLEYRGGGIFEGILPAGMAAGTYALQTISEPSTPYLRVLPARVTLVRPERPRPAAAVVVAAAVVLFALLVLLPLRRWYVARRQTRIA
jgi:hypothetical protein